MSERITPIMTERMEKIRAMRRADAKPYFNFPPLGPSQRLSYQPIDYSNYTTLYDLFHAEQSPFANPEFQHMERLELYTVALMEFAHYSPRRGACDWLIQTLPAHTPIGVLHLYDLTLEKKDGKNGQCTIGFAVSARFRRQRYATEAILHILDYIFTNFSMRLVIAYTDNNNQATHHLLHKLGFVANTTDYALRNRFTFYELSRKYWEQQLLPLK